MSREDFWESTPREIFNRIYGWTEYQRYQQQESWERTRWLAVLIANTAGGIKKKIDIKHLPFPWDKKKSRPKASQSIRDRFDNLEDYKKYVKSVTDRFD